MDAIDKVLKEGAAPAGNDLISRMERACVELPGMRYPAVRATVGAAIGWGLVEVIKPSFAYTSDGRARPAAFLVPEGEEDAEATNLPWFLAPLAGAAILGVFF